MKLQNEKEAKMQLETDCKVAEEKLKNLEDLAKFKEDFKGIAHVVLKDISKEAKEAITNDNDIFNKNILKPVKDDIEKFKETIDKNTNTLNTKIGELINHNKETSTIAKNLVEAFSSSKHTKGNWGENSLEMLLDATGFTKDIDYNKQVKKDGTQERVDYVINLPEGKKIIIDVKTSFENYQKYSDATHEADKKDYLKKFVGNIEKQITDLADKKYYKIENNGLGFVVMFMPIEAAYILAVSEKPTLWEAAWRKGVILTNANNLFALLRIIAHSRSLEKQSKNSEEIRKEATGIYEKLVTFSESFLKIGEQISTVNNTYHVALKKLKTGERDTLIKKAEKIKEEKETRKENNIMEKADNIRIEEKDSVIEKAENIRKLGINPKKKLPDILLNTYENKDDEENT